jgi:hypothetical protein
VVSSPEIEIDLSCSTAVRVPDEDRSLRRVLGILLEAERSHLYLMSRPPGPIPFRTAFQYQPWSNIPLPFLRRNPTADANAVQVKVRSPAAHRDPMRVPMTFGEHLGPAGRRVCRQVYGSS